MLPCRLATGVSTAHEEDDYNDECTDQEKLQHYALLQEEFLKDVYVEVEPQSKCNEAQEES